METRVGKTSSEFLSSEENICLATESHLRESPSKASHKNTCGYHHRRQTSPCMRRHLVEQVVSSVLTIPGMCFHGMNRGKHFKQVEQHLNILPPIFATNLRSLSLWIDLISRYVWTDCYDLTYQTCCPIISTSSHFPTMIDALLTLYWRDLRLICSLFLAAAPFILLERANGLFTNFPATAL